MRDHLLDGSHSVPLSLSLSRCDSGTPELQEPFLTVQSLPPTKSHRCPSGLKIERSLRTAPRASWAQVKKTKQHLETWSDRLLFFSFGVLGVGPVSALTLASGTSSSICFTLQSAKPKGVSKLTGVKMASSLSFEKFQFAFWPKGPQMGTH